MLDLSRRNRALATLRYLKADIAIIQETWQRFGEDLDLSTCYGPKFCSAFPSVEPRAGIAIICRRWVQKYRPLFTEIVEGRAIKISLHKPHDNDIEMEIIGFYGPSPSTRVEERRQILEEMERHVNERTIIVGDWNVITDIGSSTSTQMRKDRTLLSWITSLDLVDAWTRLRPEHPGFTTTTHTQNGPVRTRLDRCYINRTCDWITRMEINPFEDYDHYALSMYLDTARGKSPTSWKLNKGVMEIQSANIILSGMMAEAAETWPIFMKGRNPISASTLWTNLKREMISILRKESGTMQNNIKKKNEQLQEELGRLQSEIFQNPDPESSEHLEELLNKIAEDESRKSEGAAIRTRQKFFEQGEKSTKLFLGLEKSRAESLNVPPSSEGEDIEEKAHTFYSNLWGREECDLGKLNGLLREQNKRMTQEDADSINLLPSAHEIETVINELPSGKSPGPDGLTSEFYRKFMDKLTPLLKILYDEIWEKNIVPDGFTEASVRLIYKNKGDKKDLANWRPISLMNVDYKIMASWIKNRIQDRLKSVIEPEQIGFMKNRNIFEHIWTLNAVIEGGIHKRINGAFVMVDQEKAYDRVSHEALEMVLKRRGFPARLVRTISVLHKSATSRIILEKGLSKQISRSRGVFQGCPLAPLLFNIVADVVCVEIKRKTRGLRIGKENLTALMYADDTLIFAKDREDAENAMKILKDVGRCTGSRINPSKSVGIALGNADLQDFPQEIEWKRYEDTQFVYLGIHYGKESEEEDTNNWKSLLEKMKERLSSWKKRNLSGEGKCVVVNTLVIPKIIHQITGGEAPQGWAKKVDECIKDFVTTPHTRCRYDSYLRSKKAGGLGLRSVKDIQTITYSRWICKLTQNPDGFWQNITIGIMEIQKIMDIIKENPDALSKVLRGCGSFYKNRLLHLKRMWDPKIPQNTLTDQRSLFKTDNGPARIVRIISRRWIYVSNIEVTKNGKEIEKKTKTFTYIRDPEPMSPIMDRKGNIQLIPWEASGIPAPASWISKTGNISLHLAALPSFAKVLTTPPPIRKNVIENWTSEIGEIDWKMVWKGCSQMWIWPKARTLLVDIAHRNLFVGTRVKFVTGMPQICKFCDNAEETLIHIFSECEEIQNTWRFVSEIAQRNSSPISNNLAFRLLGISQDNGKKFEFQTFARIIALQSIWFLRTKFSMENRRGSGQAVLADAARRGEHYSSLLYQDISPGSREKWFQMHEICTNLASQVRRGEF